MSIRKDFLSVMAYLFPLLANWILAGKSRAGKVSLNSSAGQSTILGYGPMGPRNFEKPLLCIFLKKLFEIEKVTNRDSIY